MLSCSFGGLTPPVFCPCYRDFRPPDPLIAHLFAHVSLVIDRYRHLTVKLKRWSEKFVILYLPLTCNSWKQQ